MSTIPASPIRWLCVISTGWGGTCVTANGSHHRELTCDRDGDRMRVTIFQTPFPRYAKKPAGRKPFALSLAGLMRKFKLSGPVIYRSNLTISIPHEMRQGKWNLRGGAQPSSPPGEIAYRLGRDCGASTAAIAVIAWSYPPFGTGGDSGKIWCEKGVITQFRKVLRDSGLEILSGRFRRCSRRGSIATTDTLTRKKIGASIMNAKQLIKATLVAVMAAGMPRPIYAYRHFWLMIYATPE